MQFRLEEFYFYGSLRGLIDSWHKGPGCFVSCCTWCNKCCLDPCNEFIAAEPCRQIKLWTIVLFFGGISKLGSSAERFVVPIESDLEPDCINDLSRDGRAPVCGHPLDSLMMGLRILQYTSRNIHWIPALSWILAICSLVTNGRMTFLLPKSRKHLGETAPLTRALKWVLWRDGGLWTSSHCIV